MQFTPKPHEVEPFIDYLESLIRKMRTSEERKRGLRDFDRLFEIESYKTTDGPNECRLYDRLFTES